MSRVDCQAFKAEIRQTICGLYDDSSKNSRQALLATVLCVTVSGCAPGPGFTPLLANDYLERWSPWIGVPRPAATAAERLNMAPVGEADSKGLFKLIKLNGEPVLHVSGALYGALTSKRAYRHFHLKAEYRWGEKRWPPRIAAPRNSGLLYHCHGTHGSGGSYKSWMNCLEFQVQEGQVGDLWLASDHLSARVRASQAPSAAGTAELRFDPRSDPVTVGGTPGEPGFVRRAATYEKPGRWNRLELVCKSTGCSHFVNGVRVLHVDKATSSVSGRSTELYDGRLQIESEGAEIFYRRIAIKELR